MQIKLEWKKAGVVEKSPVSLYKPLLFLHLYFIRMCQNDKKFVGVVQREWAVQVQFFFDVEKAHFF